MLNPHQLQSNAGGGGGDIKGAKFHTIYRHH